MIYSEIIEKKQKGKKQLAVLIDPDKCSDDGLLDVISASVTARIDYFFVGGSLLVSDSLHKCINAIKKNCTIPVVIFPGSPLQVSKFADALLFISLISGRNAEALIGNHVVAAPYIKRTNLEVLPTGYILIDAGKPTTASYMSNSFPIPNDKHEIAVCTAMAGEMLGLKLIYLDAGSGATHAVSTEMIAQVKKNIQVPLIVGGGIRGAKQAHEAFLAGADLLVVGNAVEKDLSLLKEITELIS